MVTVKRLLKMMNLEHDYINVIIFDENGCIGGGYRDYVIRRFGNMRVVSSDVSDYKFHITVKRNRKALEVKNFFKPIFLQKNTKNLI